jgi:predicted nucleotidyltransferase
VAVPSPAEPDVLAALRGALRSRTDVKLALLFGSRARGTAGPASDVDVAVLAPGVDLLDLAAVLRQATGRDVDLVALEDATIPLLEELVRDAVVVHQGQRGAAAQWRSSALLALETDLPWYRRMRDAFLARLAGAAGAVGE